MEINLKKAKMKYGNKIVLDVENILFKSGNIYFVMGSNGSGKTTLIEGVFKIRTLTERNISFNQLNNNGIAKDLNKEEIKDLISFMEQTPYLFNVNAKENIEFGIKYRDLNRVDIAPKIEEYIDLFGISHLLQSKPGSLSGGEKEKIALIRTLISKRKIIILDEPTAAMDMESTFISEKTIKKLADEGALVIVVSHDYLQAERLSDYIVFLDKGKCVEFGKTKKVLKDPESDLLRKILNINKENGEV